MAENWNVLGYESLTVAGTALSLASPSTGARSFVGYLETAQIRLRSDGSAPTASEGVVVDIGDKIILSEHMIRKAQFIRTGSTSGVIKGHYFTQEASVFM